MFSQPTQLAATRRNSWDAGGKYTLRVWRTPLGDITASLNVRTPVSIAPKWLSFWSDDAAIRADAWREAHVALTGAYNAGVVRKPAWKEAARKFGLVGYITSQAHAVEVRLKRWFKSKPDKLTEHLSKTALQLRVGLGRKVERAATRSRVRS